MNHAITIGELLRVLGGVAGAALVLCGILALFAGGMSDAPAAGDRASRVGCFLGIAGIALLALALTACATPAERIKTVEVKIPVSVPALKPEQVPTPPAPLPPRPSALSAAADVLLAKVCEFEGYAIKADPLLRLSAGEQPSALPRYPECEGR